MLYHENYSPCLGVCDWWSVCMCACARSVRELSVVLNPSVTPYIWERTRKIMQNPCFPAPTSEWHQKIVLHASNTYVKPIIRSVHNSAQFSQTKCLKHAQASVGCSIRVRWLLGYWLLIVRVKYYYAVDDLNVHFVLSCMHA